MKSKMMLGVVFLLTGCPGPGDRMVERESTTAFIKASKFVWCRHWSHKKGLLPFKSTAIKATLFTRFLMTNLFIFQKVSVFLCLDLSSQLESVTISPVMFNLINQRRI